MEGNVFTSLTARNAHAVSTGPGDIESIDVDFLHVDYSLFGLIRHGMPGFWRNVEARSARIVLDPSKTPRKPRNPNKKIDIYDIFPDRVHLSDATLIIRDKPHDFVMEHVDLDLNPRAAGELRVAKLQLSAGQNWVNLATRTSYEKKTLVLHDLVLGPDERIASLTIDASRINARSLAIKVDSVLGGGNLAGSIAWTETQRSLKTELHLRGEKIAAEAINKYAGLPEGFLRGKVERVNVESSGILNQPRTWSGTAGAEISSFHVREFAIDRSRVQLSARDGVATSESDIEQGENKFHLRGSVELPSDIREFGRTPASVEVTAAAVDLQRVTAGSPQHLTGSAQVNGRIDVKNGKLEAQLAVSAETVGFQDGKIEKLSANLHASKIVPPSSAKKPWYADLRSELTFNASGARVRDYVVDSVEGSLQSADDLLSLDKILVKRKQNEVAVRGEYRWPRDLRELTSQPGKIDLAVKAVELGDYWVADSRDKISGPLHIDSQVEWKNKAANGQLSIYGANLRMRDLVFRQFNARCSIANSVVYINDFTASLNERDFLSGNGSVDLRAENRYRAKLSANIADLSTLQPLLRASGNERELAGSFVLEWEGSGEARAFKNSGKLKMTLEKGRYGEAQSLQANVDAAYTPDGLDIPIIFVASNKMNFQANAQAKGETLEISKIQLDQGTAKYASGYVSIPFIWKNLGTSAPVMPASGKVTVSFQSENLDIRKLFEDIGMKPGVSGSLNVKLDAQGTLGDLDARLDVQMRELRSVQLPSFEPATLDLTAQTHEKELTLTGKLQQAKIQPVALTANLPFDIPKVIENRGLSDDTAVNAKVQLPRSSMNFIRQFVPAIETIDGDLALDVAVKGTIAHPELSGSGDITVNVAHFHNSTLPALTNFSARLNFTRDVLIFEKFGGELAGGPFTLAGRITFPKLTEPDLDLQIKADSILIARDDSVTARADADIHVAGPLKAATVTGTIALTNSQFLKNLDLIPIGLPGRPAPQPAEARPTLSFPQPPIRDWKFDVAIKTKDPFLIRGNLANGGATVDLHLGGTGLRPGIEGTVRLKNVEATLPFSRLEIQYGFLYFDPNDSLNPRIDLHGTSVIRDYIVHVYVYGTSLAPEALFTSEPPLPQEEIISLLATGTTRAELTGNNNVLAGRAAMLLVQQLYRKIVKKGGSTKSNSVFDSLDLDVGRVDPRTGQQQATARVKINEHFVLVGDVGVAGQFRGMVKYVLRFR